MRMLPLPSTYPSLQIFSNPVKDECVRLVNSYLDELIEMIASEYTPEEICLEIRMCGPKDEIISNELPPLLNEVVCLQLFMDFSGSSYHYFISS